jgi:hypothetical protein
MRRLSLELMRRLARRRGGRCISARYANSRIALEWNCRRGHTWNAMPSNVSRGSWCPTCAGKRRLTLPEMQRLAAGRGGQCLSERYVNSETKLRWRCAVGHEWEAAPGLVKAERWCPHCAHVARLSLKAMAEIAASRGGQCLATDYVNVETPLVWKCRLGHQWKASPASIRNGSWCPSCARNQRLELTTMQRLARKRGGQCLSTKYINNRHPLLWECRRKHRWKAQPCNVKGGRCKRGTWCPECYNSRRKFHTKSSIERMMRLARRRGGVCLSREYLNSKSKLIWQCDKGHRWRAVPSAIQQGSWCPVCRRNRKLTLEEFRGLAANRGGRCLSIRYVNKATALRWQCVLGHRWYAQPGKVKRGTWCARCANLRRRSRWRPDPGRRDGNGTSAPGPSQPLTSFPKYVGYCSAGLASNRRLE